MKSIFLGIATSIILMLTTGCNYHPDSNESALLTSEIEKCLNQISLATNDSTFQQVIVNSMYETSDYNVWSEEPKVERPGVIKVDIHVDKSQSEEWFVGYAAILAVASAPIVPIAVVFIICFFMFKSKRERYKLIEASIHSGYQLPEEFLIPRQAPKVRLQSAFAYLAWGIGLMMFFKAVTVDGLAMLMLIPIIIGLGKLIAYCLDGLPDIIKRNKRNISADNDAD